MGEGGAAPQARLRHPRIRQPPSKTVSPTPGGSLSFLFLAECMSHTSERGSSWVEHGQARGPFYFVLCRTH